MRKDRLITCEWITIFILGLAFCVLLGGCSLERCDDPALPDSKLKLVSDKAARYEHVAWWGDYFIFEYAEQFYPKLGEARLWRMRPDGTDREQLRLPGHPNCTESDFVAPQRLQDGRLGYVVMCVHNGKVETYMMAYDFRTAQGTPLMSYPSPIDLRDLGRDSWNPRATQGIVGSKIPDGLYKPEVWWLWQDLWSPVPLELEVAMNPIWSPNGKMIAFAGLSKLGNNSGWDAVKDLYLMDPDGTNIRSFASGFSRVFDWTWSPDSHYLALSATFHDQSTETNGIWLIEVSTGKRQLWAKGYYDSLDWSASGRELVLVGPPPVNEQQQCYGATFNTRLYRLDVASAGLH